ncbi:P-loop containing nucleoside triphosphate hydrolase protein [Catenaria anguillulae PL171]|uniref:RNA helicase n=1 Tax=Catenaria anguillulae PL171 TaxID=765915 RepID=A0A1Y2HYV8_9FUNG|nr:P-loop containing nucleoside triphosphate hydrolase protein [Catenaria anguillulae PL171]
MPPPPLKRKNPLADSDASDDDGTTNALARKFAPPVKRALATTLPHADAAPAVNPPASIIEDAPEEDEDDDPLEAFMAQVDHQAKQDRLASVQAAAASASAAGAAGSTGPTISAYDEPDGLESFVQYLADRAGDGEQQGPDGDGQVGGEDQDSDEEVYRTAYMIERQLAEFVSPFISALCSPPASPPKGNLNFREDSANEKREIEPLKPIDHSTVEYIEIEKDFYVPHDEVAAMIPSQILSLRKQHGIRVSGPAPHPSPLPTFSHLSTTLDPPLLTTLATRNLTTPTPIQMQALPLGLSGRDVIGVAATGSGKTLAYLLPMFPHIMDQPELTRGEGPIALILAPTRELAQQITAEATRLAPKSYALRIYCLVGGGEKGGQWKTLRKGVDVLVATPGRLIEMCKNKATSLGRVSYLVIDEADRMLEEGKGFEAQVRSVCRNVRPDRQTMLFSATVAGRVEALAREVTSEAVKVVVGGAGDRVSEDVDQVPVVVGDEEDKVDWLVQNIDVFRSEGSVLVFATRKSTVDTLHALLSHAHGLPALALHGDLLQPERESVIARFRSGKHEDVLIATDVAARGLDISSIRTVVCFDPPRDLDTHTHRVGRTGRAGKKGKAYILVMGSQDKWAADVVAFVEASGKAASDELMRVAMKNGRFAKARRRGGIGSSARGGRGGRGRGRGRGGGLGSRGGGGGREMGVLSGSGIKSASHASNLLMAAFTPSSKASESAAPPGFVPPSTPIPPPSATTSTPASKNSRPSGASPAPALPPTATLAQSSNPLLQALAKHRSKQ